MLGESVYDIESSLSVMAKSLEIFDADRHKHADSQLPVFFLILVRSKNYICMLRLRLDSIWLCGLHAENESSVSNYDLFFEICELRKLSNSWLTPDRNITVDYSNFWKGDCRKACYHNCLEGDDTRTY